MRRYSPQRYSSPPRRGYGARPRSPPRRGYGGEHGRHKEQSSGSLLVRNIPLNCRPEELRVPFERYGVVRDVYLPKNYYTGEPRGFAFVQFVDPYEAAEAQYHMNGKTFAGREISVVVAAESRKRPEDMRRRTRTGKGPLGYEAERSSYYGSSRSHSRSCSPRYATGSRSRHRSRSHSPVPRWRKSDYSVSPERREDPRSPRDRPPERDGHHSRRSYSPRNDSADRDDKGYAEPAYESDGAGKHRKSSPRRESRSPSGSRSRSADVSRRER